MRRVNLKRLRRAIQEMANPKERLELVRQSIARVQAELAALMRDVASREVAHAAAAYHPGMEPGVWHDIRQLQVLAWILLAIDLPVQYVLNASALPMLPGWVVALGSAGVALGIAGAVRYLGEPLIYEKDRPARSIRITKVLAACSFLATAAGASVSLFARQAGASVAEHLVGLTSASLWTVAEALPLTAGFVGAWAHMLARPLLEERRLDDDRQRIAALTRLLAWLESEEADLEGKASKDRPDDDQPLASGGVRVAALAFVLLASPAVSLASQVPGVLAGQPHRQEWVSMTRAHLHAGQQNRLCAPFADRTASLDSLHRAEAIKLLNQSVLALLRRLGCAEVVVGTFADEGPWAPRQWLPVPAEYDGRDCTAVPIAAPEGTAGVLANIKGFHDHFEKEALARCARGDSAARQVRQAETDAFLRVVRGILDQPPLTRPTKTDLVGLFRSLIESGVDLALVITDGIDTAHDSLPPLPPLGGTRIVLLLVPAREANGGQAATNRAAERWRELGIESLPYTVLVTPSAWTRLATEERASR